TAYNSTCGASGLTLPITQRTVTTSLPNGTGTLQSKASTFYNSYGLPTEADGYAYGSGAPGGLVRKTVIAYASLGNSILDHPSSVSVYDSTGTNLMAQTTYAY